MAMISGYFDAAGHESGEKALTVGGFMAPVRNWAKFRKGWRSVLDEEGIAVFHMTDFMVGAGVFGKWKDRPDARAAFLQKLSKLVRRHAHYAAASTIILEDWKAINAEFAMKECHAGPYSLAAFSVIDKCMKWFGKNHPQDYVAEMVFEKGDTGHGDLTHFMRWVQELAKSELGSVYPIFRPKTLEPLQSCDFATWEKRYAVSRALEGNLVSFRPSFAEIMKVDHDLGVIDRPKIIEHCEGLGVPPRHEWMKLSQRERAKWRPAHFRRGSLYPPSERARRSALADG